jgi:hypothetical protein
LQQISASDARLGTGSPLQSFAHRSPRCPYLALDRGFGRSHADRTLPLFARSRSGAGAVCRLGTDGLIQRLSPAGREFRTLSANLRSASGIGLVRLEQ